MKGMKKLIALGLTAALAASTVLAGCGGSSQTSGDSAAAAQETQAEAAEGTAAAEKTEEAADTAAEPITIQFWNSWTGSDGELLTELVNEFNENNEYGITIEMDIMPAADMGEKLATSMVAGTAAPLLLYSTNLKFSYGKEGLLKDMSGFFDATSIKEEDFNPAVLELGAYEGVKYYIPLQSCAYYMFWNKDLFEQAGLDPDTAPATWDEWAEFASKITDESQNIYGSGIGYNGSFPNMAIMMSYGGDFVSGSGEEGFTHHIAGNEGYTHFLQLMQKMINDGDNPLDTELETMFKAGRLGMVVSGPWMIAGAKSGNINYGVAQLPAGDNGSVYPLLGAGFAITSCATDEETQAAYRFLEWWFAGNDKTEKTACTRWSTEIGYPAFYQPTVDDAGYKENPDIVIMADYGDNACQFVPTDYPYLGNLGNDIVVPLMESVAYGADPAAALEEAQEKADALGK